MITPIPLAAFCNAHFGLRGTIVGRGPTRFDYQQLAHCEGPVLFLNDAVQFDQYVNTPSYLLAIDNQMVRLLERGMKSIPVLPREFEQLIAADAVAAAQNLSVVFYECNRTPRERLLQLTKEELCGLGEIYNGTVTVISALHFLWFCGCNAVDFIGCDGINDANALRLVGDENGYDQRLVNISGTRPAWKYDRIREEQERVCRTLGLATRYLGTPELPHPNRFHRREQVIPRIAHYVWLGGALPEFVQANISRFQSLHPNWEVHVWHGIPDLLPEELRQVCFRQPQLCMRSDIIRTLLLHRFGGIYLDGDVFPIRPFDELLHYEHFFGSEHDGKAGTNCVMGTAPGSTFIDNLLNRIRASANSPGDCRARSAFGPRLLTEFIHAYPGLVNPLPDHYFCLFQDHTFAFQLVQNGFAEVHRELVRNENRFSDGVWPYGIHTYGIPADSLLFTPDQSSFTGGLERADALLRRLPPGPLRGVEVGVADGRMSSYLLGHLPRLHLTMVDRWMVPGPTTTYASSADSVAWWSADRFEEARLNAITATDFAASRRKMLQRESAEAAAEFEDGELDFVFIDADHTYGAVKVDIDSWQPKLKAGGWLCGHDYHGLEGTNWGVARAVEEFAGSSGLRIERDRNDTWFIQIPESQRIDVVARVVSPFATESP